jgi:hypothetical protein
MGEVLERLAGGEAVTISLPVHEDGWAGGEDGLVVHDQALETECDSKPDLCGGHTVLLTGYDQEKKLFTFKNSWGESWGQGGYGQLSYEYFKDWTYGEWFVLDLVRLDKEPQSPPFEKKLSSVGHAVRWDKNAEGEEGVWVDLRFDYQAPLGTFYYVSLFAQTKKPKTEDQATDEPQYENVLLETEAGESDIILDRRFILSQSKDDLSFSEGRPLSLFLPKSSLEKAGVLGREDLVLRPTIYGMSDRESYQILNRVYLTVPPLGTGDRRTVNSARLTSFP